MVVITCGALGDPGQKGHCPEWECRSVSSPTITHERVMGSLRSSMLSLVNRPLLKRSRRQRHSCRSGIRLAKEPGRPQQVFQVMQTLLWRGQIFDAHIISREGLHRGEEMVFAAVWQFR